MLTLTSELKTSLAWLFQDELDLTTVSDGSRLDYVLSLSSGTGAGQADRLWHDERTLATSAHENLVLSALPQSLFGDTIHIAMASVRALLIVNLATDDGENLELGGAASDEWQGPFGASGSKLIIPPDSCLLLVNKKTGWPVAASSADRLRIASAGSGDISYKIALLGTSS